jgi:diphosphomevalonate decarboxylase
MNSQTPTALAHPNIAFIKYWGNRDNLLRLPANSSLSMNLGGLHTRTQVKFDETLEADVLSINGQPANQISLKRVSTHLDLLRDIAGKRSFAQVTSENNFPTGTGIASSASAFAALTLAACTALDLDLSMEDLSRLARRGSGSACRSIPGGFVEWVAGTGDHDSYAFSVAPPGHWDLMDCIAIVSQEHKSVGSSHGHTLADTSPIQVARIADTPRRLELCKRAILNKDFDQLAPIVELDSNLLHAVMMTSTPGLLYWQPATVRLMRQVQMWRSQGIPVCYTIDAGPNVHILTLNEYASKVNDLLGEIQEVECILISPPAGPAWIES